MAKKSIKKKLFNIRNQNYKKLLFTPLMESTFKL